MKLDPTLYLVTNSDNMEESTFLETIRQACKGGITLLQLREKNLTGKEFYDLAIKVKSITDQHDIPLIINDRIDIAMATDAAGVHLGQSDIPLATAKAMLGHDKILGATTKTLAQAQAAYQAGANYLGVGAIYPTKTKVITVLTPIETLKEIAANIPIPTIAIGGLDQTNLSPLKNSGAKGIAVVRAIMESNNPKATAAQLLSLAQEIADM
ncbi:MAG: thiamine phosphate synthase [Defluviitaleaceae bacterium]|nr:thiamine phosphate synthase [Defluviitaleaceae bacterium]